ncbi:MAG: hypothetical protein J7518_06555 [Nocardioidaceae bacterium]|nr:hypothetical protein [Nocardioidaceae bacterium]
MTEQQPEDAFEDAFDDAFDDAPEEAPQDAPEGAPEDAPEESPREATGHPAVDEVLRSLDALRDAPVDEHVAVFESAHEQLRRTLQGAGDDES